MKRGLTKKIVIIILMVFLMGSVNAFAEEEGPTASGDLAFVSKYMWRGYELSEDSIVVQPSMSIGYKGLGLNAWSSLDTDPEGGDAALNETDLTVSYDTSAGPLGIGMGYIYYGLDSADDTQEFYLSASYDTILAPSLTLYRDFSSFPGYYISLGLSHSIEMSESIALDLSGAFGYYISNDDSIVDGTGDKYSGLQDGMLSASISIPITEYVSLSPSVSYAFPLSDDAEDFLGISSGEVFGGVVLSFSF